MNLKKFLCIFILFLPTASIAETHSEVQAAMDYELPENTCVKPKPIPASTEAVGAPLGDTSSSTVFEGSGADEVSDIDSYTRKRLERKHDRYNKCLATYKDNLLTDMEELKASAQYGLTQSQADIILSHMAEIQKVYMTQDGVLIDSQEENED